MKGYEENFCNGEKLNLYEVNKRCERFFVLHCEGVFKTRRKIFKLTYLWTISLCDGCWRGQICSVLSEVKSSVCEMVIFVAIASYRRWSHIRHRNEWVMATIEYRSSPDFEPISPTVYIRVSSLFDIRTTSYWVQHTPKCHFCRSCRDITEDDKHFTIISRWRVIKTIKIFPCRNILTSVIDVSWKLRGKIFTVKTDYLNQQIIPGRSEDTMFGVLAAILQKLLNISK